MADTTRPVPAGECRQCWTHAYDRSIHAAQDRSTDCGPCVDHMKNGCPPEQIVPGRRRTWF
ncbi:pRL2-8 [Kitasatospora cineracea]|uniref:PRL2-8 n=1 Tax=Kitasatospora cineracea TaxID=88074 RepID=A0A3N4RR93_9ACTN|nr:pRL2-8 [Kitasatospora cineracea]RPE26594.1 hypothetical protein EDD38_7655 [Kitasatospora cineracea]